MTARFKTGCDGCESPVPESDASSTGVSELAGKRRVDPAPLLAFAVTAVGAFLAYFFTLAPTVTLEYSGSLAVVGMIVQFRRHWRWGLALLSAFVMFSFVVVSCINPSMDMQDSYIQRVRLIQSYGVLALWLGAGVMYTYQDKHDEAVKALSEAIRLGGKAAREDIRRDSRLAPFLNQPKYAEVLGSASSAP